MSTYNKITIHPQTGVYEEATYHDDYYGEHLYGVEFASDRKVYPLDLVDRKQIWDFYVPDVIAALKVWDSDANDGQIIQFLNNVQAEYKKRWERDPIEGEGAVDHSAVAKLAKAIRVK